MHYKGCLLVLVCNLVSEDISLAAWGLVTHTAADKYQSRSLRLPLFIKKIKTKGECQSSCILIEKINQLFKERGKNSFLHIRGCNSWGRPPLPNIFWRQDRCVTIVWQMQTAALLTCTPVSLHACMNNTLGSLNNTPVSPFMVCHHNDGNGNMIYQIISRTLIAITKNLTSISQ